MSAITLLDGSLKLSIYYDTMDKEFDDDICLCFQEDCPEDEKVLGADEVSIYITPEQAALVALALNRAIEAHRLDAKTSER